MAELRLPDKVRLRLLGLYQARQTAEIALQGPTATALEFLGLDPTLPHQINFDTGIVTPAVEESAEVPAATAAPAGAAPAATEASATPAGWEVPPAEPVNQ